MSALTVTVYIDELILQNCIIGLLLLVAVGRISGASTGFIRCFIVSLLSGVISAGVFFVQIPYALSFVVKLAVSILVVLAAYGYENIKRFLKRIVWFYVFSLVCAGAVYMIQSALNTDRLGVVNLTVYADISPVVALCVAFVCYAIAYIISVVKPDSYIENTIYPIELSIGKRKIVTAALVDTGNSICDIYNGYTVIICSEKECKRLFGDLDFTQRKGYRILPCSTVTGQGYMSACLAESAVIHCGNEPLVIMSPLIAMTGELGSTEYGALLPSDILKEIAYEKPKERNRNYVNDKRS